MATKECIIRKFDVGSVARFMTILSLAVYGVILIPIGLLSALAIMVASPIAGIITLISGGVVMAFVFGVIGALLYVFTYIYMWIANKVLERFPLALEMDDGAPEAKRTAKRKSR